MHLSPLSHKPQSTLVPGICCCTNCPPELQLFPFKFIVSKCGYTSLHGIRVHSWSEVQGIGVLLYTLPVYTFSRTSIYSWRLVRILTRGWAAFRITRAFSKAVLSMTWMDFMRYWVMVSVKTWSKFGITTWQVGGQLDSRMWTSFVEDLLVCVCWLNIVEFWVGPT